MARTLDEIMNSMVTTIKTNPVLAGLSASASAIWRLFLYIIADAHYNQELIFDQHKADVSEIIRNKTPHRAAWYSDKAKLFQFGHQLVKDTDYYDNSALTEEQVLASRVVKYSAAIQSRDKNILYLKVATDSGNKRTPIPQNQMNALKAYFEEVSDAGVYIEFINSKADDMELHIDIYYNALILDGNGKRLDGTSDTPVQNAIRAYFANLPFNGIYTNQGLIDELQQVQGVEIAELKYAASHSQLYKEYKKKIDAKGIAYSGYYEVTDNNLVLNFIMNEELL